jgi:hypothetical protein
MAKTWADLAQPSPNLDAYPKALAAIWREIGCEDGTELLPV